MPPAAGLTSPCPMKGESYRVDSRTLKLARSFFSRHRRSDRMRALISLTFRLAHPAQRNCKCLRLGTGQRPLEANDLTTANLCPEAQVPRVRRSRWSTPSRGAATRSARQRARQPTAAEHCTKGGRTPCPSKIALEMRGDRVFNPRE
jgi:hypothetical protein